MLWPGLVDLMKMREFSTWRSLLDALVFQLGLAGGAGAGPGQQTAFTIGVVALGAKMAKADGVVAGIEVETFERFFRASEEEASNVRRLFDLAKQDVAGFEAYARDLRSLLAAEPAILRDVLEGLFHIASADGVLHHAEDAFLKRVAEIFELPVGEYRALRAQFVSDDTDPLTVLGLPADAGNEAIKSRYRRLVRENHPDALMARGAPVEAIEVANRKLQAINAAYERLARERGL